MNRNTSNTENNHSDILEAGVDNWNEWRAKNPNIRPDLFQTKIKLRDFRRANFDNTNLGYFQFEGKDCREASFNGANMYTCDLRGADFSGAQLSGAELNCVYLPRELSSIDLKNCDLRAVLNLEGTKLRGGNLSGVNLSGCNLTGFDLTKVILDGSNLSGTNFTGARMKRSSLKNANVSGAIFDGANLKHASFYGAIFNLFLSKGSTRKIAGLKLKDYFKNCKLHETDFSFADFSGLNLSDNDFRGTILRRANLSNTDLTDTNFESVNLEGANLQCAQMIRTNVMKSRMSECKIYGLSAWAISDEGSEQNNLLITNSSEASVTVDNLEVGQFVYLILNNQRIRSVIDTITSKVVLILGRFTPRRKKVLDNIKSELRNLGYCPILFDFKKPDTRDLTESVATLAHLARFIIADLTDAKSIPQELQAIIPNLPSVPVQPIITKPQQPYSMFEHYQRYSWVLPLIDYDEKDIAELLREKVIPNINSSH